MLSFAGSRQQTKKIISVLSVPGEINLSLGLQIIRYCIKVRPAEIR